MRLLASGETWDWLWDLGLTKSCFNFFVVVDYSDKEKEEDNKWCESVHVWSLLCAKFSRHKMFSLLLWTEPNHWTNHLFLLLDQISYCCLVFSFCIFYWSNKNKFHVFNIYWFKSIMKSHTLRSLLPTPLPPFFFSHLF